MAMSNQAGYDHNSLAAEYVLGTLDKAEAAEAEALLRTDSNFAADVEDWRRRFDPLLAAPPVSPPGDAFDRILAAISPHEARGDAQIVQLRRRLTAWRWTAGAALALAASLLIFIAAGLVKPSNAPVYVAVLQSSDNKAAFIAATAPAQGGLYIRRVGAAPPPNRSFELWAIRDGAAPQSLGVVDASASISPQALAEKTGGEPLGKILLAITEEPAGGAPEGKPTSPPIFTGKLIQTSG